jgi:hypothetical protein
MKHLLLGTSLGFLIVFLYVLIWTNVLTKQYGAAQWDRSNLHEVRP